MVVRLAPLDCSLLCYHDFESLVVYAEHISYLKGGKVPSERS